MTGTTILLADDQESVRKSIPRGFPEYNWVTAANGLEALDILKNQDIDLYITDIRMPEMDGIELIENVEAMKSSQALSPELPHIILTGYDDVPSGHPVIKGPGSFYVSKPWGRELEVAIDRALDLLPGDDTPHSTVRLEQAASLCHDIGGYLGIGAALVDDLGKQVESEEARHMLSLLRQGFNGIDELIQDFYAGHFDVPQHRDLVEVGQVITEIVRGPLLRGASESGITFLLDLVPEDMRIRGLRSDVTTVVSNLLSNSMQSLSRVTGPDRLLSVRSSRIYLSTDDLSGMVMSGIRGPGWCCAVEVSDSGVGIPREFLPLIFRDRCSTNGTSGGGIHGFGLISIREALKRLGGALYHEEAPGGGARMFVYFPLADAPRGPL